MTPPDPPTKRTRWKAPWRSAVLGWVVAGAAALVGVPLFLCMPPWNDVTLHDMVVRSMLRGGVNYRDVFDTNLPGIDWAMAGVRALFGWSYEVLRAVDLLVIAGQVCLLVGWVRKAGASSYTVAWLVAAVALFYPFTSEFNHVQRDPWLLLPALIAARLRVHRVELNTLRSETRTCKGQLGFSLLEGLAWGSAVWVKPHVVFPALAVWGVSAVLIARAAPVRVILVDLAGLLLGGLLAGAAGVAWLIGTGAWPYFVDVFTSWNPGYLAKLGDGIGNRLAHVFACFGVWSLLQYLAFPLAVLALWEGRVCSRRPGPPRRVWGTPGGYSPAATETAANSRALLAALYLGWLLQAVALQKEFDYVQVPLLFLGMGVVATHRWSIGFVYLVWFALVGFWLNVLPPEPGTVRVLAGVRIEQQPFADPKILRLWPRCWTEGSSPELRNKLGQLIDLHCGTNWEELDSVAGFLRGLNPPPGPRELNCWHDSTHPLYLMLDLEPATRYMHYGTVFPIPGKKEIIVAEVAASPQRYVVSDLMRMTWHSSLAYEPGAHGEILALPAWFPASEREKFPWNQPIVFRSGRYLVHQIKNPLGVIDIPDWQELGKIRPGK